MTRPRGEVWLRELIEELRQDVEGLEPEVLADFQEVILYLEDVVEQRYGGYHAKHYR
jgi:hypothetical protein